jgi:hypothetical protein
VESRINKKPIGALLEKVLPRYVFLEVLFHDAYILDLEACFGKSSVHARYVLLQNIPGMHGSQALTGAT